MLTGVVAAIAATVVSNAEAGGAGKRQGTSVLHYLTRNTLVTTNNSLVTTNGGTNVTGSLRLQFDELGSFSKQSLLLKVSGLETNTAYTLIAIVGDDTNAAPVDGFTTDASGEAQIRYPRFGRGCGGTGTNGTGTNDTNALPAALNPLTDVRSIGIENASTQTVAYAWIADAEQFQYLVKRKLTQEDTNSVAAGSICLFANEQKVFFKLLATGLGPTNQYQLALNSNIVSTVTANTNGRVVINSWPSNAPPVLELSSLALIDASSNIVLSTTFPRDSSASGSGLKRCWNPWGHWHSFWEGIRHRSHHDDDHDDDHDSERGDDRQGDRDD